MLLTRNDKYLLKSCVLLIILKDYFNLYAVAAPISNLCALSNETRLPEVHGNKFYYFGFGSNMLADRIHLQNPSAVRIGVAQLSHHRLDFAFVSARWNGAAATIVPDKNAHVFGTLWNIDLQDLKEIDDQEGVALGIYEPKTVVVQLLLEDVHSLEHIGDDVRSLELNARAYMLVEQPKPSLLTYARDSVPENRQPSKTYLQCLVKGAEESGIPVGYVNWLRSVRHNGRTAPHLERILKLHDVKMFS